MEILIESAATQAELLPINRIRVETALSRFPIHRLAKKQTVTIDLQHVGENGETDSKWEVTYNQKHGQPGPLAYKIDTLIVNRRIDEAGRPIPNVIRLGSLTELCSSLGISDSGENRSNLRKALHQNASAYITAKIRYRTKTGKERWGEIGYTRYSVVFTGEVLPDERVADAVYIIPNTSYRELLNHVEVRPLDYDYLTTLTPGAQRFYELLSFQMYGALAGNRPRAKLLYSEYCKHAPQSRYVDFNRVKKQMFKIHAPHREAGYIGAIEYQSTIDGNGAADWEMLYRPGVKAIAEYEAFTRRQSRQGAGNVPTPPRTANEVSSPEEISSNPLLNELTRRGVAGRMAMELIANLKPGQEAGDQLEYVDFLVSKDSRRKLDNPPGLYVAYLRDDIRPPSDFASSRKRDLLIKARQDQYADQARKAQIKLDYDAYCVAEAQRYIAELMPADEFSAMLDKHVRQNRQLFPNKSQAELEELSTGTIRVELLQCPRVPLLEFNEFIIRNHYER